MASVMRNVNTDESGVPDLCDLRATIQDLYDLICPATQNHPYDFAFGRAAQAFPP
jgi:hypothetical protein